MADIIINGPEGQSTINNIPAWATEATQKTIADTLKGIGSSADKIEALLQLQSKGIKQLVKTGKEGDKELADLFERVNKDNKKQATSQEKQSKAATDTINNGLDQLTKIQSDGVNQLNQLNKETAQQNKDLDKILDQLNDSGSGLMSFASGGSKLFGALGFVLDGLIGGIKILGGIILSVASYIGKEFMDTFNILNNSLKQGTGGILGLTRGVDNVATAANMAGMSLEEFADFAAANSKILRTLSASGFADLYSKTLLASNGLLDIGMTADDAVESVMNELEYRRRFGIVLGQSTLELQSGLMRSARELRVFANAVGISEADLRQQSEIQEQHIDLMAGQAKAMGKNESEMENMINAAQRTSRVLAAMGGEDLINPLFESISKGATGLSDEFVELGVVLPQLFVRVGAESEKFLQSGEMSANLGYDIMMMMRNLSDEQQATINNMQRAGVGGAAAIQQMQKNANRLTNEMINAMRLEPDEERQSLLRTFNSVGFVVNQATSAIGDFGKTMLLSMLGFGKADDGYYDFTRSVGHMSDRLLELTSTMFGRNSKIYDVVKDFTDYMELMTGADTDPDKLEKARTKFADNISNIAESVGDGLYDALQKGTFLQTITDFFKNFIDQLKVSLFEATDGLLFSGSVQRLANDLYVSGELSAQKLGELNNIAGFNPFNTSYTSRGLVADSIAGNEVQQEADKIGVTTKEINLITALSGNNTVADMSSFNKQNQLPAIIEEMDRLNPGFKKMFNAGVQNINGNLSIRQTNGENVIDQSQYDEMIQMIDNRISLVDDFNNQMLGQMADEFKQLEAIGIEFNKNPATARNVLGVLDDLKITNDISANNDADAQAILNALPIYLKNNKFDAEFVGGSPAFGPRTMYNLNSNNLDFLSNMTKEDYAKMTKTDIKDISDTEYNNFSDLLKDVIAKNISSSNDAIDKKGVMTYQERNEILEKIDNLDINPALVIKIEDLVNSQTLLTNQLLKDSSG